MSDVARAWSHDPLALEARQILWPYLRTKRFVAGEALWREGDTDGMLVALEKGRVKAFRTLPDGRPVTLYLFGPGAVFGFVPFLDGGPFPASAQALDTVEARVMSREGLREAIRKHPDLALTLLSVLGQRLREAFDRIQGLSSRGVVARVAAAFEGMVEGEDRHATLLRLPVSASEFARTIGITPESFSRAVTRLCEDKILHRLGRGQFQVLDAARLRGLAEVVDG